MIKSEIQLVRSLSDKKSREELGLFIAEGEKLIKEVLDSSLRLRKIYLTEGSQLELILDRTIEVEWINEREMDRISQLKSANRALALVEIPHYDLSLDDIERELTIVLDGVQNPGNLGTIIRLADWFGIRNIICSVDSADCFNPKVVQATMGAILRVQVHYCDLIPLLSSVTAPIYGTFLDGDNLYRSDLSSNGLIVMGNEGQGVSPAVELLIHKRLYIPPYPNDTPSSESLNVAIATAIICSEFRKR